MPEIDPITRDALRRASQMQSRTKNRPKYEPEKTDPKSAEQPEKPVVPADNTARSSDKIFGTLFGESDKTLILLLIVLLMDSEENTTLLLALFYLLT